MCTRILSGTPKRRVSNAALLASAGLLVAPSTALATTQNPQNGSTPIVQPNGPDLNGSGRVDFADLVMLLSVMSSPNAANPAWVAAADLNQDGVVNFADLSVLLTSFGQVIPPPPPAPPPPPPEPETPPVASAPVIDVGSGFFGPLVAPEVVGDPAGAGADAKAIARWNAVPGQFITGQFHVGVIAFHMNGINRVEFVANGGDMAVVNNAAVNPDTGNTEYYVTLDTDDLPDGPVELRAIVYPNTGVPRILQGAFTNDAVTTGEYSMTLNVRHGEAPKVFVANSGSDTNPGTRQAPLKTIGKAVRTVADGGEVVLLHAGTYEAPNNAGRRANTKWITVRPDDGLTADDVIISNATPRSIRVATDMVAWKDVTIDFGTTSQIYNTNIAIAWLDGVKMRDSRGWSFPDYTPSPVRNPWFATNCDAENMIYAFPSAALVRNSHARQISGDVFQMSKLIVGCTAENVSSSVLPHHTDVFQWWGPQENVIAYDVEATNLTTPQCMFMRPSWVQGNDGSQTYWMRNTAFVDLKFDMHPVFNNGVNWGGAPWSQIQGKFDHVIFQDIELANQRLMLRTDTNTGYEAFEARNLIFRNVGLHPITYDTYLGPGSSAYNGVSFVNCYSHPDAD